MYIYTAFSGAAGGHRGPGGIGGRDQKRNQRFLQRPNQLARIQAQQYLQRKKDRGISVGRKSAVQYPSQRDVGQATTTGFPTTTQTMNVTTTPEPTCECPSKETVRLQGWQCNQYERSERLDELQNNCLPEEICSREPFWGLHLPIAGV